MQKGKAVDAREWGNISLSEAELDVAAQATALDSFKPANERATCNHHQSKAPRQDTRRQSRPSALIPLPPVACAMRPTESRPAAQLAP